MYKLGESRSSCKLVRLDLSLDFLFTCNTLRYQCYKMKVWTDFGRVRVSTEIGQ